MITEGTQLWHTLFSRLCHSVNRQSSAKFPQFAQKCYSRYQFLCKSPGNLAASCSSQSAQKCYLTYQFLCQSPGNLAASCSSLSSSRSRMSDKSPWSVCAFDAFDSYDTATRHEGTFAVIFLTTPLRLRRTSITFQQPEHCPWLTVFLPCQHKVVQWPPQSRPTRRDWVPSCA